MIDKEVGDLLVKHPLNRGREERVLLKQPVIENNKNEDIYIDIDKEPLPTVNLTMGIVNRNTEVETVEAPIPTARSLPGARAQTALLSSSESNNNSGSMSVSTVGLKPAITTMGVVDQPASNAVLLLKGRPPITRKKEAPSNSMVFNFVNSDKVVTHIENDGMDMSKRRTLNTKVRQC